jgi:RNA polymerase sigma factor (sigma-70 family)
MVSGQLGIVVRHARRLAEANETEADADGRLLRRFLGTGEEAAFAALVERHGPMVLGVCQRVLRDGHAAEDAFQATFLVLFRRARSLCGQGGSLAGWLYTVAYRVALKARADAARRRLKEGQAVDVPRAETQAEPLWQDLQPVLDDELNRLPEKYRVPLVLCYLEGRTNEETGRLLGLPVGTVKSRLARARERLRGRLSRRGLSVAPALLAATLTRRAAASVPAALVEATVRTAAGLLGRVAAAVASGPAALAEGVLKGMLATRLTLGTCLVVVALVAALGAAAIAQPPRHPAEAGPAAQVRPLGKGAPKGEMPKGPERPAPGQPWRTADRPLAVSGRVLGADGKPLAGAEVVVMTCPWRYIQHAAPRFAAGYEVLARGRAGKDGAFRLSVPRDRWAYPMQSAIPLQVIASALGHGPGWRPVMPNLPGDERAGVEVRLPAEEILSGRLIDLQGRPAAGVKLAVVRVGKKAVQTPHEWEFLGTWDGLEERTARVGKPITQGSRMVDFHPPQGLQFWAPPDKLPFWPEPVVTDADGRFRLSGVGRGQGVGALVRDDRFALQLLDLEPPPKGETVTRAVTPARLIEGTVVAADTGKPLAGALVQVDVRAGLGASSLAYADWKGRRLVPRGWGYYDHFTLFTPAVRTDAAGRFRLSPFVGESAVARTAPLAVTAAAPDGQPYLTVERSFAWPRGAVKKEVRLELPRGALVRGKVLDKESGQPVPGARVDFWSKGLRLPAGAVYPGPETCAPDGTFRLVVPAGKCQLLVNAPRQPNGIDPDYVARKIAVAALTDEPRDVDLTRRGPGAGPLPDREPHCYPCGWVALDLGPGAAPAEVRVTLQRKAER